jgi:Tol biopolymer transport system component
MDAAKTATARFNLSSIVFESRRKLDGTDAPSPNNTVNIWRVNADATGLMPLTTATAAWANSLSPQWSRDGSAVVFCSSRKLDGTDAPNAYFTVNIWRVNADATGLMPLTTATTVDSASPQWSPDGSTIVFYSSRRLDGSDLPGITYNIWRVNADGRSLRPITTAVAPGVWSFDPQWSPDGSTVVFHSSRKLDGSDVPSSTYNIWRVNADGTGLIPLTNATAFGAESVEPQWSPDGSKVVFYSSRKPDGTDAPNTNGTYNIWRVNADGTGLIPLTTATARGAGSLKPQWSPDGSQVVFYSGRRLDGTDAAIGTSNIWRVNAGGTGLIPLTNATADFTGSAAPQWSPSGSEVVFRSSRRLDGTDAANGASNIWRVNAEGSALAPLTSVTAFRAYSDSPSFSP